MALYIWQPFRKQGFDLASTRQFRSTEIGLPSMCVGPERLAALGAPLREERHAGPCEAWLKNVTPDATEGHRAVPGVRIGPNDELQDQLMRIFPGAGTMRVQ
jgi:hypothetical protein